ncbi:MAG TPA: hypothetical protein VHT73_19715 [Thermodesulfobacteriota bacterium]|nr:hypothetical protein [Thermodesulfobacteriota bacterium]
MYLVYLTRFFVRSLIVFMVMLIPINGLAYEDFNDSEGESLTITYGGEIDFNSRYVWCG